MRKPHPSAIQTDVAVPRETPSFHVSAQFGNARLRVATSAPGAGIGPVSARRLTWRTMSAARWHVLRRGLRRPRHSLLASERGRGGVEATGGD